MNAELRPVSPLAKALAILLALPAPARMAWIVLTYGENVLSNDYIGRVGVVTAILEGRYHFGGLFRDTFIVYGHSWLALLPFYLFDARFFDWNMHVELGMGLLLAGVKVVLIWLALAEGFFARTRWLLLPVLSALAFQTSQVSSFTFGESTLQMQLPQVGLALGAFSVARHAGRPNLRIALVSAGGLLASWSWGGGVMVWPAFVLALVVARERDARRWCVLGLTMAAGMAQYVWILGRGGSPSAGARTDLNRLLRFVDLLGRPFANDTGWHLGPLMAAVLFGATGLALVAAAVWVQREVLQKRLPALVIVGWSLLAAMEIAYFRGEAAPWYLVPMAAFWMGLAGLLVGAPLPVAAAGLATIAAGLLFSNRTWEDKSFYLPSRSPASAACLRAWRSSSVNCHDRLFQWGGTNLSEGVVLGEPLERLGLSVFAPKRTYLLQGDAFLGRVAGLGDGGGFLSRDGRTPGDVTDWHRLDLVLAPGANVTWSVDVPPRLRQAAFETRVRARDSGPAPVLRLGVDGVVAASGAPGRGDAPLVFDLRSFAGRTITLRLETEATGAGTTPIILEAPRIELLAERPHRGAA